MGIYLKKFGVFSLCSFVALTFITLLSANFTDVYGFGKGVNVAADGEKDNVFVEQVAAEAGSIKTVTITKESGEGVITLDKAYVLVKSGIDAGNVHLHEISVDGITLVTFGGGELPFLKADEADENETKFRGGEVMYIVKNVLNASDLKVSANNSIVIKFMAMGTSDTTAVSLMIHVKSSKDAEVTLNVEE